MGLDDVRTEVLGGNSNIKCLYFTGQPRHVGPSEACTKETDEVKLGATVDL